ncbi:MAG TPA: response regulator transcription factor [Candidatus Limnocylindrales bacterium]|jgi:DNA-binding NarL/FixJ family response regulator|nr:response regulator transcription factor [Candidatus Limnocylindrales bacterium]
MSAIRIVLIDDHAIVREGLHLVLERYPGLEVVGEAANREEGIETVVRSRPDIVVMDISLADIDGLPTISVIHDRVPTARVVMLTMFADAETVRESFLAGASAYVVKGASAAQLVDAIRAVHRGERYVHSSVAGGVIDDSLRWLQEGARLSPREREVLSLLAGGRTAAGIGDTLGISTHTVRRHLANSAGKLGLHGTRALARYAEDHGLRRGLDRVWVRGLGGGSPEAGAER